MSKVKVTTLEDLYSTRSVTVPDLVDNQERILSYKNSIFESLRRSYAEAGFTLVDGSFEEGGTLTSTTDVLLHKASGIAYSGPIGDVPAGTDPTAVGSGYVPRTDVVLRDEITRLNVNTVADLSLIINGDIGKRVQWMGYYTASDGGGNWGVVKSGAHTHDGLKIFSISDSLYVEANLVGRTKVSVLLAGARRDGNQATPSHAAIQVALNYCKLVGSVCYFPAGVYEISQSLMVECSICGDGVSSVINQRASGIDALHISVGSFLTGMTYSDIRIFCWPNAGHIINVLFGLGGCRFINVHLEQYNPAKSVFYHHPSPDGGMYDCLFSGGVWTLGIDSSRSVSGFDVSVPGTLFNENEFNGIRLYNSAGTTKLNAKPWFSIKNTGTQVWLTNNRFKGLNFEVCHGGGIYIEDCKQCEFSGLSFWDTDTHAGDGVKLGQGAGLQPIANKISLLQRHTGVPVAVDVYDIDCSLAQDTIIESCFIAADKQPKYNLGSTATRGILIGYYPDGSVVGGETFVKLDTVRGISALSVTTPLLTMKTPVGAVYDVSLNDNGTWYIRAHT